MGLALEGGLGVPKQYTERKIMKETVNEVIVSLYTFAVAVMLVVAICGLALRPQSRELLNGCMTNSAMIMWQAK